MAKKKEDVEKALEVVSYKEKLKETIETLEAEMDSKRKNGQATYSLSGILNQLKTTLSNANRIK
jgi:hypothetical protein